MILPLKYSAGRSVGGDQNYPVLKVNTPLDLVTEARNARESCGRDPGAYHDTLGQASGAGHIDLDITSRASATRVFKAILQGIGIVVGRFIIDIIAVFAERRALRSGAGQRVISN